MKRTFKFLMRPTVKQAAALTMMLEDHRELYNAALAERRDAYQMAGVTVRYGGQSARLKEIRACDEDQARWSFSSQQATLRRLDKVFVAFFRRARVGERPGYPRFKGAGWFDTVEWPKDGDGCRWDSQPDRPTTRVRLQGVGHVKVHRHRPVAGRVKTVSVKREGRRWYVVLSCDDVPRPGQFLSNGQAAKSGLNRSILDAGWGAFVNVLRAKAESAGRVIVEVDARHTSQRCAARGRVALENRVVQARFCCVACGHRDHADVNGAVNILRAGLARQADAQAA